MEVFNTTFGPCQSFQPSISNIMLKIDDAEARVRWVYINVAKIEQESRLAALEEAKKKREMDEVQVNGRSLAYNTRFMLKWTSSIVLFSNQGATKKILKKLCVTSSFIVR